jgi:DNA-binding transcriptional LysR family regulator
VVAEEYEHAPRPHDRAFERHPLGLDRLVLVLAEDHPAARAGGPVALKALADEAWAAPRPGTAFNDMVVRACRSLGGFEPDVRHQANDLRLLLHLARSGLAVALVPSLGHEREPGVAVRELKGRGLGREIFAATRRGSDGRPAVAATLAALAEQAGANGLITD